MKKIILIVLICLVALVGVASADPQIIDGYYQIGTVEDLQWFATQVNAGHTTYNAKLTADIDLTGVASSWVCIGSSSNLFSGIFDGQGHTITGFTQSMGNVQFVFLQGATGTASTIRYTNFKNFNVNSPNRLIKLLQCGILSCCSFESVSIIVTVNSDGGSPRVATATKTDNCCFISCTMQSTDNAVWHYNSEATLLNSDVSNSYSVDGTFKLSSTTDRKTTATFTSSYYANSHVITNCVAISSTLSGGAYNHKIANGGYYSGSKPTVKNCYATNGGSSTSDLNGLNIGATQYNSQSWWQNTVGFDFVNTWYWDEEEQLPKLQAFKPIAIESLTLTTPTEVYRGELISAEVVATASDVISYQWYSSHDTEILTAVYCTDQTAYPFNQNGGITVKDENNQYWRCNPTTGSKTALSGASGDVINRVDYIQGTGSQYINTGVAGSLSLKTEIKANFQSGGEKAIFGSKWAYDSNFLMTYDNMIRWHSKTNADIPISLNNDYVINTENGFVKINGNSYSCTPSTSVDTSSIRLYQVGDHTQTTYYGNFKTYYFKMWNNNGLIRDYIPVQINGVYYLLDNVEHKLYANAGSGSFTGGGTPTPITFSIHQWNLISGQTSSTLSYTQAPVGDNYFKVIVSSGSASVDSLTKFPALHVLVKEGGAIITDFKLTNPSTGHELPTNVQNIQAYVDAYLPVGEGMTYQWFSSNNNETWSPLSGQTSANLSYAAPEGDYYYKVIIHGNGFDTDSLDTYAPLFVSSFYGLLNNTVTSIANVSTWANHADYYDTETITLGTDLDHLTVSIPHFRGGLVGNSHKITHATVPLFTNLSGAIQDIVFEDCLTSGIVADELQNNGYISNVSVKNSFISNTDAGGIVNKVTGINTRIFDCSATLCTIQGTNNAGGIAAVTQDDTEIARARVSQCDILGTNSYGVAP